MPGEALLVIDVQNDFVPGGALAVPRGDEVVALANAVMPRFELIVATQDWHPPDHRSFASQHPGRRVGEMIDLDGLPQVLWPDHCVQGTAGADLVPSLDRSRIAHVVRKGTDRDIDSYSGFFDNGHRKATGLHEFLRGHSRRVDTVYVLGLATDYCVRFTALDARQLGYRTLLIEDATRGVNLQPQDSAEAIRQMREAGVEVVSAHAVRP